MLRPIGALYYLTDNVTDVMVEQHQWIGAMLVMPVCRPRYDSKHHQGH